MASPRYCRLQDTVVDLRDCGDALRQREQPRSEEEAARHRLVVLCCSIAAHLDDEK